MTILEVKSLKKIYTTRFGGNQVQALSNVNFSVEQGEYVAIMGESGSGKTTLLNILAALDRPSSGQVLLNGKELSGIREKELAAFRRENLGFVFQEFNLLDTFSVKDNIFLPLVLGGVPVSEMEQRLSPIAVDSKATDDLLETFRRINAKGQTILMVTHSTKAASHASRVLFIKDGEVFHQIYRGDQTNEQLYQKISYAQTVLATGGEKQ
jgi:putative ABC transport system ATP-binding protein